ncbi:hypothetical protein F4780DRAFT_395732 [Xylariomycetidae sp. FL0641]|nr:hypothetical protein F4780DRAFT_395732 [Xylariomycetidae sp. FL0641]
MCVENISTYPCGHQKERWQYCSKAVVRSAVSRGPPQPCASNITAIESPDLGESCRYVNCATKPWQCGKCGLDALQTGWRCRQCRDVRDGDCTMFTPCRCPGCVCYEAASEKAGSVCDSCTRDCKTKMLMLGWLCHVCALPSYTSVAEMKCQNRGCGHRHCVGCKTLFDCTCKCGCFKHTVEYVPGSCRDCLETCPR